MRFKTTLRKLHLVAQTQLKARAGGGKVKRMAPTKLNRGQRRRMKKIKKKYANQSDDERRMRMAALGNPCQRCLLKASRCTQTMMVALASMAKRRLDSQKGIILHQK